VGPEIGSDLSVGLGDMIGAKKLPVRHRELKLGLKMEKGANAPRAKIGKQSDDRQYY
jgi:hypothetical protein